MNNDFAEFVKKTGQPVAGHYDRHWNETGLQVAAQIIYKWLMQLHLLKS
jgi:hypothetical protein